jgi:hypothetical protein
VYRAPTFPAFLANPTTLAALGHQVSPAPASTA